MLHITQAWSAVLLSAAGFLAVIVPLHEVHAQHHHSAASAAKPAELGASAAFDPQGRLWVVGKEASDDGTPFVTLRHSDDTGKTWSGTNRIAQDRITARGEERPKIAFGPNRELYIVYTRPAVGFRNPHVGDVRFLRSLDEGKTFSESLTVHVNRDAIVHAFGSLIVDAKGNIFAVWIDGRNKENKADKGNAGAGQKPYAGSALYYAVSTDGGKSFRGDYKIADHSCECCQLSLSLNEKGRPVVMWRHIFDPNIRDHALAELAPDGGPGQVRRVSFDNWRVDACPHHGPSIAFAPDGTRHQAWFNMKKGEGGIFYASADAGGRLSEPVRLGSDQAKQPEVAVDGKRLAVAWKQFDGSSTALMASVSTDGGSSWNERELARTENDSGRPQWLHAASGLAVAWNTQEEGMRVIPLAPKAKEE